MAVRIRKLTLWTSEVAHQPGALADALEPFARTGAELQMVVGYRSPNARGRAIVEVAPSARRRRTVADVGPLAPGGAPTLLVEVPSSPGVTHRIARALAESRVNIAFVLAQVIGRRYSAVLGFDNEADLDKAADRIRQAALARPVVRPRGRRSPRSAP